jgi:hypothetical protein
MYAGDEFYDDEVTSGRPHPDWIEDMDFRRKQLQESSPCFTCGSPDPAIIDGRFCCECEGENAESFEAAWAARRAAS